MVDKFVGMFDGQGSMKTCRWKKRFCGALAALTLTTVFGWNASIALADTPAVTDFGSGSDALEYTFASSLGSSHYAMFLTLYEDGRQQVDVRPIHGDDVVSFRTNHRTWELSQELMWFMNMPVYIKEVPLATDADTI